MSKTRRKSLVVSLLTASLELMLFWGCTFIAMGRTLILARWFVGAIGALVNFVLNRRWAFQRRDISSKSQGRRYAVIAISAVSLGTILWCLGMYFTQWDARLLHVMSMMLVWLSFTYPMFKKWVFSGPSKVL